MATNETSEWSDGPDAEEESLNAELVRSFQSQNGLRGAHFYDGENCEFVRWDLVVEFCNRMKDGNNPAHLEFEEKLLGTIINTNPDTDYVLVRQTSDVVTIECYRLQGL